MILVTVIALFSLVSCNPSNDAPKSISVDATTLGFADEFGSTTVAKWTSDETLELYRSEDWSSATFSMVSGANEELAKFLGTDLSSEKLYALRSATPAPIVNGKATISVPSHNIFLADENSSLVAPQIGEGTTQGLTFTPIFGAIKLAITGDFSAQKIQVIIPNQEIGINGNYIYDVATKTLQSQDVEYSSTRTFDTPITLSATPTMIYVALPEGAYSQVELRVNNPATGELLGYTANDITIEQGKVTSATNISTKKIVEVTGTWRMSSFCGSPANIDLYITFTKDLKFTMYQRTESLTYITYSGTYSIDTTNATLSGEYDDGRSWANSYKVSYSDESIVLTNTANSTEVSIYEPATAPTIHTNKARAALVTDIKPL